MEKFEDMLHSEDVCAICGASRAEHGRKEDEGKETWVCLACKSYNRTRDTRIGVE